ncbi:MAG TPA: glycosyltransferase family 2 protein [Chitinophagaceae bacterium]|nr:glycosyltransferase family 2 protein [Chitinophagaceae bacterium]
MEEANKLSVLIACYNEERTVINLLKKVLSVQLPGNTQIELIVVDDASTDNSFTQLQTFCNQHPDYPVQVFQLPKNTGKGACLKIALSKASGNIVVFQDADLEYDPHDYHRLLRPILEGHADVVYGSRFRGSEPHRVLFFFHTIGNKFLTFLSNVFTQLNLTDMETGYKMFKTDMLRPINIKENRFGIEPEITAKISRIKGVRIYEVGISYFGRTFEEGKKINWKDGIRCMYCILKYNIFSRQ